MASSAAPALSGDAPPYERRRPEQTPLYDLVEEHFPRFLGRLDAEGVSLPHFAREEFEAYRKCGRLEHGFLRVKCDACRHEKLVAFSCKRRGLKSERWRATHGRYPPPSSLAHLTRYHGVFAPNFKHRHHIVPNPVHPSGATPSPDSTALRTKRKTGGRCAMSNWAYTSRSPASNDDEARSRGRRDQCRRRPSLSRASSGPTTLAPISSTIRTARSTSSALEASTPRLR